MPGKLFGMLVNILNRCLQTNMQSFNQWESFTTTHSHTNDIYYPIFECYTFATFPCHVRNISTGSVVCTGIYGRMVS